MANKRVIEVLNYPDGDKVIRVAEYYDNGKAVYIEITKEDMKFISDKYKEKFEK